MVPGSAGRAQGVEPAVASRIYSWSDRGFRLAPPSLTQSQLR